MVFALAGDSTMTRLVLMPFQCPATPASSAGTAQSCVTRVSFRGAKRLQKRDPHKKLNRGPWPRLRNRCPGECAPGPTPS